MAKSNAKKKVEEPKATATPAESPPEEAKKGGKTKLIIIASAVVLLLIAGGAGAYLYFAHPKKPVEPAKQEEALPVEAKPVLVKVDSIVAPLTNNGAVVAYVYLEVNIQVKDEATGQEVKANLPRLRDAFARDLYDRSIADPKDPGRADIPGIQARLLDDVNQVFGAESATKVYIINFHYARA